VNTLALERKIGRLEEAMAELVTEEMVHAFAAVGTYRDIAAAIKKRFAGVNRLSFDMPVRSDEDRGTLKEIVQDLKRP